MSRGPGRIQRYILAHLAALEGQWCPAPDLAAAYARAAGIPLEARHGRRYYQRAIAYAPRAVESAVYRAASGLTGLAWSRNKWGLYYDCGYHDLPPWLYCYRDASFPRPPQWPPAGGTAWRARCRTPVNVAGLARENSRNT
jgi:hypothetical protein